MQCRSGLLLLSLIVMALLMAGCVNPKNAPAEDDYIVRFEDAALEAAVRERRRIPPEEDILRSQLDGLIVLDITEQDITFNNRVTITLESGVTPTTLADLIHFQDLGSLSVRELAMDGLDAIGDCKELQALSLSRVETLTDLSYLPGLPKLEVLILYENKNLKDFSFLEGLEEIEEMDLHRCGLEDLTLLRNMTKLKKLLIHNNRISDLTGIEHLVKLTEVDLRANRITDLTPLASLEHLRKLRLDANRITDPSPLSGMAELELLILNYNSITSLEGLGDLPSLTQLSLRHNPELAAKDISALRKRLPQDCVIEWA